MIYMMHTQQETEGVFSDTCSPDIKNDKIYWQRNMREIACERKQWQSTKGICECKKIYT